MEEPQSAALTDFWATRLRQQKKIKVDVPDDVTLHITKASLDADAAAGRNVVLCRHDQGAETAVCALSIDGAECFDLSGLVVTGETLEFYNRGNSTVHLSGYTVDDSAEGGEEEAAAEGAEGSEGSEEEGGEEDGDVLTDEETAAIQASMARGDDMEVSSDEDEEDDDDGGEGEGEGDESESPEGGDGGSEGSDGSGSSGDSEEEEEEDDESESESESEEEEEAAAPPPKKKAKSAQPAEAAKPKPAKSASAPAAKLAPDSEAGQAALAKWRDACAAVVKANPGTKLTALGQQQPLPTSGKLSKQLGPLFVIDKQTQEVTLS